MDLRIQAVETVFFNHCTLVHSVELALIQLLSESQVLVVSESRFWLPYCQAKFARESTFHASEAPDDVVNRFISAGAATVEIETGSTVDPANCTDAEAEAIRNIAAIYCAYRITGGSA